MTNWPEDSAVGTVLRPSNLPTVRATVTTISALVSPRRCRGACAADPGASQVCPTSQVCAPVALVQTVGPCDTPHMASAQHFWAPTQAVRRPCFAPTSLGGTRGHQRMVAAITCAKRLFQDIVFVCLHLLGGPLKPVPVHDPVRASSIDGVKAVTRGPPPRTRRTTRQVPHPAGQLEELHTGPGPDKTELSSATIPGPGGPPYHESRFPFGNPDNGSSCVAGVVRTGGPALFGE